ncbi:MAG: adenylate kinase family protein [Phycisphaerales bacterium]
MPEHERYKSVLLFGAPGVGKGTQGKILASIPGFFHLSTGDMFRALDPLSDLGKVFRQYSTRGELVPDSFTVELWKQYVESQKARNQYRPYAQLLVLDGIPRNLPQCRLLEFHTDVLALVHLDCVDEDAMVERLKRRALREKRADDAKEDVIRRRLQVYRQETSPVLEFFPQELVHKIDALGTPAEVLARILAALAPIQAKHFGNALS